MNVAGLVCWTLVLICFCATYVPQIFKKNFLGFDMLDSKIISALYVLSLLANILFCLK